ncbi:MAG: serine/threonine protein kinase [Lentisphaerae bacterium]|nr:serine/threonine protein kinase [Lentisphaerota bacterium]
MTEATDVQILTDPVDRVSCPKCAHKSDVQGLPAFSSLVCANCGQGLTVPARLGHFLLLKVIGLGGMGGVYQAHDEVLNRQVAIKVMRKSLGDNLAFSETFLREAQAAARINHPNIVQIHAFGMEKGQPYIVMELVLGGGLEKLMAGGVPLDQALVMGIGKQVAEGLRHASDEGMVHGDVKPENILLFEGNVAKLVDFGLASVSGTASNEIWGTPYYIAPEKVRRQKTDHRADIYSLGGTLYHAMAGRPPFDGPDANAVVRARFAEPLKPLVDVRPDIDPEVSAIITRMLQVEPGRRYPTYGSLLSDMRRVLDRLGPVEAPPPTGKKIVLRRKGKGTAADPTPANPAVTTSPVAMSNTSQVSPDKKIVVGRGVMSADFHTSGSLTDKLKASGYPAASADATDHKPGIRMWVVRLIVVLVLLGILGVLGSLYGLLVWKKMRDRNAEAAQRQQVLLREDALAQLQPVVERAKALANQCAADAQKARAQATNVAAQAAELIPETMRSYLVPPPPEPPRATANEEPAPPQNNDEQPMALDTEQMAEAVAAAVAAGLPPTKDFIVSYIRKIEEKRGVAASATPAAADGATGEDGTNDAEVAAAAPIPEQDLPPVVQRIRSMFRGVYELDRAADLAARAHDEIEQAIQAPDVASRPLEALRLLQAQLTHSCETIEAQPPVSDVAGIVRAIADDQAVVQRLLDEIRAEVERQAREVKAREAAAQAARDLERQADERKARIQADVARVADAEKETLELMHALDFRKAARALRTLGDGLETSEGKSAVALAQDKLVRIEAFYVFLGGAVPGVPVPVPEHPGEGVVDAERPIAPFRHPMSGWTVQKADATGITVNNITKTWVEADKDYVIRVMIIRHLLQDRKQASSLRFRYRIQQYINAALFLKTFIPNSPSVNDLAVVLAREAISLLPQSRKEIDRLMPGLLKIEE